MAKETWHKVSGTWRRLLTSYVNVSSVWKTATKIFHKVSGVWKEVHLKEVSLSISANSSNVDVYSLFGSPIYPAHYILTIDTGVTINSTSTATASLIVGTGWHADSIITIINDGNIVAKGGAGGEGGDCYNGGNGDAGGAGGSAIALTERNITIDNTNGNIFGGGGGGGGGGGAADGDSYGVQWSDGGGGGGGAGDGGGAGGVAGISTNPFCTFYLANGSVGLIGSTVGGAGGAPGGNNYGSYGASGATGGGYGVSGGIAAQGQSDLHPSGFSTEGSGGSGGAAGKAADLNGYTIIWLGGNNSTQVKGAVL